MLSRPIHETTRQLQAQARAVWSRQIKTYQSAIRSYQRVLEIKSNRMALQRKRLQMRAHPPEHKAALVRAPLAIENRDLNGRLPSSPQQADVLPFRPPIDLPSEYKPRVHLASVESPPPSALTRRQREIAALIACGLSNAQIAAELVLCQGTVANHVEAMLTRLGFRSRVQIAVWAIEQGVYAPRSEPSKERQRAS